MHEARTERGDPAVGKGKESWGCKRINTGNYKGKRGLGVKGSGQWLVWPTNSRISTTSAPHTGKNSGKSQIEAILQGYEAPVGQGIYEPLPLLEISAARQ